MVWKRKVRTMQQLNIYIDETGEFGFGLGSSKLYGISFVFHESQNDIISQISRLNNNLKKIGYTKMIHTADLINNRGDYVTFSLEQRKQIFNMLYQFARVIPVKYFTIIVDKKYSTNISTLKRKIFQEMQSMIINNYEYFTKFGKVLVYYDNGQKELGKIIIKTFAIIPSFEQQTKFNHEKERLFQVADMLTYLDKYNYKLTKKYPLNKNEKMFFDADESRKNIRKIINKHL